MRPAGLNCANVMPLSSCSRLCSVSHLPSIFLHLSPALSSLSPCHPSDLWLCLSEGHTSLPTPLFVSTLLHFFPPSPPVKATRNQQKINPWLPCARRSACVYCVCFFPFCVCVCVVAAPLWVAPALEGKVDERLGAASAAVLTKWASRSPCRCRCCRRSRRCCC